MSACATGCGAPQAAGWNWCQPCAVEWVRSDESERYRHYFDADRVEAARVAVVDFCTRVRLERQNGGSK